MSEFSVNDEAPRFVQLWDAVFFDEDLSNNAKIVYGVLQRMAWETRGEALRPKHAEIAKRANLKDRETVAGCLNALEARGHIRREGGGKWDSAVIILVSPACPRAEKTDTERAGKTRATHAEKTRTYRAEKTRTLNIDTEIETIDTPSCVPPLTDSPPEPKAPRRKPEAPVAEDFTPHTLLPPEALRMGWNEQRARWEVQKFIGHHRAKGSLFRDHEAAWRNWVRTGLEIDARNAQRDSTPRFKTQADHNSASARVARY